MFKYLLVLLFFTLSLFSNSHEELWKKSEKKQELEKHLDNIILASKKPIYHLRLDILEETIKPLLSFKEFKALTIFDNYSKTPFLIAFKEKEEIKVYLNEEENPSIIYSNVYSLQKDVLHENIHIANIKLYLDKSKINLTKQDKKTLYLNDKELAYLKNKKFLSYCSLPNYPPYSSKNENNIDIGIFPEIRNELEKKLKIDFKASSNLDWTNSVNSLKNRQCDLIIGMIPSKERKEFALFTEVYLEDSLVITTKNDKLFVDKLSNIKEEKIAIIKGYAFYNTLKKKYPQINFLEVENANKGLSLVSEGKIFGFIDSLASTVYHIQHDHFINLKISGQLQERVKIAAASRNDEVILNTILQKAINNLGKEKIKTIFDKWALIKIEQTTEFKYLKEIIIVFAIILLVTQFWLRKLRIANKKLEESHAKLKVLASTDSLTKLYNRGYFTKLSKHILSLAKRNKTPLSLIIMDIDDFKKINDSYGHQIGDKVIVNLADILKASHRSSDITCRFGGEEFIILLPESCIENSFKIAKKLNKKVQKQSIEVKKGVTISYTISIGVSTVDIKNEESIEDAIKRADEALYEAKEKGKNQAIIKT